MKSYSALKRCVSLAVVLLASLMLIPLGGCMNTGLFGHTRRPELNEEECRAVREEILDHLEEKYGIFFSAGGLHTAYVDKQDLDFWGPTGSHRQIDGTCTRTVNSDGSVTYEDDYAFELFEPLYQERVEALAKETVKLPEYALEVGFLSHRALPENIRSVDDLDAFENLCLDESSPLAPGLSVHLIVPENDPSAIDFDALTLFEQKLKGIAGDGSLTVEGLSPEKYAKSLEIQTYTWIRHISWGYPEEAYEYQGGANDVWTDVHFLK